jgi:hypothetical protein
MAVFAIIWTLLALVATLVIHALDSPQQSDFARIAVHPATTQGLVTLSDPSNHDSFLYRYHVGQLSYTGGSRLLPDHLAVAIREAAVINGRRKTQTAIAIYQTDRSTLSAVYAFGSDVHASKSLALYAAEQSAHNLTRR